MMWLWSVVTVVAAAVNNSVEGDVFDVDYDHPRTVARQLESEWPTPAPWPFERLSTGRRVTPRMRGPRPA